MLTFFGTDLNIFITNLVIFCNCLVTILRVLQPKNPILCYDYIFSINFIKILATEANDDRGIGHMVEHLVFMRSEKYPYKGFLDTVLNLCKSTIIFTHLSLPP
uniref:Peptidase M16 N-terminal domain-containing protein n=1 Tax=Meloidogyne incognita TaxID=6306 RepID=A0A914MN33_MELIC